MPDICLSTDMIVGFPGETDLEFDETMSLVSQVGYHSMFSFKYSERPNTLASKRFPDDVPAAVKTSRIVRLQETQKQIQDALHAGRIGSEVDVLVDSTSRRREWEVAGRTTGNTVVNFTASEQLVGSLVSVRITGSSPFSLRGELVATTDRQSGITTAHV